MIRSRAVAYAALAAMAFAALLPFSAAARMLLVDHPVEFCHELSVAPPAHAPADPDAPAHPRKRYCPFCASAAVAPPASPPPLPGFVTLDTGLVLPALPLPRVVGAEILLPPSRAPPADLSS